jgi:hypothetical protein
VQNLFKGEGDNLHVADGLGQKIPGPSRMAFMACSMAPTPESTTTGSSGMDSTTRSRKA